MSNNQALPNAELMNKQLGPQVASANDVFPINEIGPSQRRFYYPYVSPCDPCPPIRVKSYVVPPNLFIPFQPLQLPQFSPMEALCKGTLWPMLFSPYEPTQLHERRG